MRFRNKINSSFTEPTHHHHFLVFCDAVDAMLSLVMMNNEMMMMMSCRSRLLLKSMDDHLHGNFSPQNVYLPDVQTEPQKLL